MSGELIRAAGGVVWRLGTGAHADRDPVEVLLVHRPKYDDWSLPKGKCDPDERDNDAALREVLEETGLRCRLGTELVESHYTDGRGRPKVVRYWTMHPVDGAFVVNDEVDEVRWVSVPEARRLLTYERDLPVIDSFEQTGRDGDT
jgi:8-oxo-dGTP pyrophosphatase MutT (NUDIX family)